MTLFIDKAWGYGDANPDHYFLAPNYRMTELRERLRWRRLRQGGGRGGGACAPPP
ncbi:hypothetical protein HS125_13140 [bacterium]|nr:hypothetical protein [bacterium]